MWKSLPLLPDWWRSSLHLIAEQSTGRIHARKHARINQLSLQSVYRVCLLFTHFSQPLTPIFIILPRFGAALILLGSGAGLIFSLGLLHPRQLGTRLGCHGSRTGRYPVILR